MLMALVSMIALIGVAVLVVAKTVIHEANRSRAAEVDARHRVVYELIGQGRAENIVYTDEGDVRTISEETALPWRRETTVTGDMYFLRLEAQSTGGAARALSCRITVDGTVVNEATSEGAFAEVSCAG